MQRLHNLVTKTTVALLAIIVFTAVPATVLADNGQSAEGQISGGNIYQVKDETTNSAYGTTTQANACDDLRYKVLLYNPGPGFLTDVMVKATLPSGTSTSSQSTITASSTNAMPASTSASATVNFSSAQSVSYTNGTTELLDQSNNLIKNLPDGITQGGVDIGQLNASTTEFVQFDVKVSCPTPPPPTPVYTCNTLGITAEDNRTVKVSAFNTTATNGAVFNNAVIDWGDSSTPLTSASPVGQTHQYGQDGTYTIAATAHFTVNGQDVTAGGASCQQQITFKSGQPPIVTPPATTPPAATTVAAPTTLVNTGAGSVIGIFTAASAVGAVAYRRLLSRRLAHQK
jgi:uncharacterized repeat protein (TIGR01451 family)